MAQECLAAVKTSAESVMVYRVNAFYTVSEYLACECPLSITGALMDGPSGFEFINGSACSNVVRLINETSANL